MRLQGDDNQADRDRSLSSAIDEITRQFSDTLESGGLWRALRFLNSTTSYRFTGVYRFEPGLVKNVALTDRETPGLLIGEDVPWFDSYCMMTANDGTECEIQNSMEDSRLLMHAARHRVQSYCAVLLQTPFNDALGTLCHFDVVPRAAGPGIFPTLHACRAVVDRHLWRELHIPGTMD